MTYDWSDNAYLSGDGPCLEFTYLKAEEKGIFNDLSCTAHLRLYICQHLTTPSRTHYNTEFLDTVQILNLTKNITLVPFCEI